MARAGGSRSSARSRRRARASWRSSRRSTRTTAWLGEHGELERRRARRAASEVEAIAVAGLRARIGDVQGGEALETLAKRVVAGELDPYTAADRLLDALG